MPQNFKKRQKGKSRHGHIWLKMQYGYTDIDIYGTDQTLNKLGIDFATAETSEFSAYLS